MNRTNLILPTLFFLSLFLLNACTLQKRMYTGGYAIQWNLNPLSSFDRQAKKECQPIDSEDAFSFYNKRELLLQKNENEKRASFSTPADSMPEDSISAVKDSILPEKCDVILLKTGDEIQSRVESITDTQIKYTKCNAKDSILLSVDKKEVFMVQYGNGEKYLPGMEAEKVPEMKQEEQEDYVNPIHSIAEKDKKIEGLGKTGFIISLLGLLFAGIILGSLGVFFGIISLSKIKRHPEKYKNKKGFAIASMVIGGLAFIGALLLFVLFV